MCPLFQQLGKQRDIEIKGPVELNDLYGQRKEVLCVGHISFMILVLGFLCGQLIEK